MSRHRVDLVTSLRSPHARRATFCCHIHSHRRRRVGRRSGSGNGGTPKWESVRDAHRRRRSNAYDEVGRPRILQLQRRRRRRIRGAWGGSRRRRRARRSERPWAGQGGQATGGGKASTTASYASHSVYGGTDGGDVSIATIDGIILAAGGYGGYRGGGGGGGYTGGAGGTSDWVSPEPDVYVDTYGTGGEGSGFLADDERISWDITKTPGTNAGNGSITVTYTMPPALVVSGASDYAMFGVAYEASPISVSGGTAPHTYEVTDGALPAGLTLDANTGEIAGTPTTAPPLRGASGRSANSMGA